MTEIGALLGLLLTAWYQFRLAKKIRECDRFKEKADRIEDIESSLKVHQHLIWMIKIHMEELERRSGNHGL